MADELTLSPQNVAKLQSLGLLSNSIDSDGFWTLRPLIFMYFPLTTIKDHKVPYALNIVQFLQYLGLQAVVAQQIFGELTAITEPTQIKLTHLAKEYVSHRWHSGPYTGAELSSVVGNMAMAHMGLNEYVIGLVNALWLRSRDDPSVMTRPMNDAANGPFESYTLLVYVLEIIDQLRTKIFILDKMVSDNIP